MKLNANSRAKITITAATTVDPALASVELLIDNIAYPCVWTGAAVSDGGVWTRVAETVGFFAGPDVPTVKLNGATTLTAGKHTAEVVVEVGGTIIGVTAAPIEVK